LAKLKDKIQEFANIATDLPENLQVVCFELLLKQYLESLTPRITRPEPVGQVKQARDSLDVKTVGDTEKSQEDFATRDLHIKMRRFLEKHSLTIDHLNNLFYKEGDQALPLYDDLKTTRAAEGQIRIALLQALQNAINTGEFVAQVEQIREESTDRKCYDSPNFTKNFRNNKSLFDFTTYTKNTTTVKLSEDGRTELAGLIKELQ
jgi:hypothetical protein